MDTTVRQVEAIDVHAHYGTYVREGDALKGHLMSGGLETVLSRARQARVALTVVSPLLGLLPRLEGDPVRANRETPEAVASVQGLAYWVLVSPLAPETMAQAEELLASPLCAGIKIHPEEHGYPIVRHGEAVLEFAARHRAVVLSHSGDPHSMPEDFIALADAFPGVRLILAHLGNGWDGDMTHQVRAVQAARHGNVYTDTSSISSLCSGLIEWAVREIGAHKVLFGTDSPLYHAPAQRARIDNAEISDEDRYAILRGTAEALLGLSRPGGLGTWPD